MNTSDNITYSIDLANDITAQKVAVGRLSTEISESTDIPITIDQIVLVGGTTNEDGSITGSPSKFDIVFQAALDSSQESSLTTLLQNHSGNPLVQERVSKVELKEEDTPTQGHPQLFTVGFKVPAVTQTEFGNINTDGIRKHYKADGSETTPDTDGEWIIKDISFPYQVSLKSGQLTQESEYRGHVAGFEVSPYTTVGFLTADVSTDDEWFYVDSSALEYLNVGYCIHLDPSPTNYELSGSGATFGRVLEIDKVNGRVKVETAATQGYDSDDQNGYASPMYVKMTTQYVSEYRLGSNGIMPFNGGLSSASIPANTVLRLKFKITDKIDAEFWFSVLIEIFY